MDLLKLHEYCLEKGVIPDASNIAELWEEYNRTLKPNNTLNPDYLESMYRIHNEYGGQVIFCGSLPLYLNGLLDRHPKDIDVISLDDYYSKDFTRRMDEPSHTQYLSRDGGSGQFNMGDVKVKCFSAVDTSTDIKIDVFHRSDGLSVPMVGMKFDAREPIWVETVESCIKMKMTYASGLPIDSPSKRKHLDDLEKIQSIFKFQPPVIDDLHDSDKPAAGSLGDDLPF